MHASSNNELERRTEKPLREKIKTSRAKGRGSLTCCRGPSSGLKSQLK